MNSNAFYILMVYIIISFWIVFKSNVLILLINILNPRLGVAASSSDIDNPSGVATAVATTNYHSLAGPSWILLIPPAVADDQWSAHLTQLVTTVPHPSFSSVKAWPLTVERRSRDASTNHRHRHIGWLIYWLLPLCESGVNILSPTTEINTEMSVLRT